jgi:hypothetical protein
MKKVLILVTVIILALSLTSLVSAAPTLTFKPYMVMMYENIQNDAVSEDMFRLIQVGFDTNVDFGQGGGFNSEIQIHDVKTNADASLNSGSSAGNIDIRVNYAYLYQNNLLLNGDSLNVGVFNYVPFRNGYGNEPVWGTLGTLLSMSNALGAYYTINQSAWDASVSLVNAKVGTVGNDIDTTGKTNCDEGYNYAFRFNYKPIKGLTAGAGYQRVALQSNLTATTGDTADDNYNTEWIADVSYNSSVLPISGIVEYASVTPTVGGKDEDALTGAYAECAYKVGKITAYAGRGINLTSSSTNDSNYKNNIFLATSQPIFTNNSQLYKINNDYTLIGVACPVSTNVIVRGEYLTIDDDTTVGAKGEKGFMIWCRVSY